jgi:hypothetical protein
MGQRKETAKDREAARTDDGHAGADRSAREPTAEDFTGEAVQRAVLLQTIQHPSTILPAAVGTVALLWSTVIDLSPASLAAALGSFFIGASAWIWNYYVQGEKRAGEHVRELLARRTQVRARDVEELAEECRDAGFEEGAREARQLAASYDKLRAFLEETMNDGNLSARRFQVLAEDTYQQGVSIVRRALGGFRALKTVDVDALKAERDTWRQQLRRRELAAAERDALDRKVVAHTQRLDLCDERRRALHLLLAEANELETALETTYLHCVDLMTTDTATVLRQENAAKQLETAIEAARRAEERLRRLGRSDVDEDREYFAAGQRSRQKGGT